MGDSAQSAQPMPPQAAARWRLFGHPKSSTENAAASKISDTQNRNEGKDSNTSTEDVQTENTTFSAIPDDQTCRKLWERRWDQSPEAWREFVSMTAKVFGLSEAEEQSIKQKNKSYVATPPLSGNGGFGTAMIIGAVGSFSKVLLAMLNDLYLYRMELLYDAIEHRSHLHGLLTFSNHQSVMDDPFLLGAALPARILFNPKLMRWGLCSLDICFQNALISRTLRLGKAIPIQRRGGIHQSYLRTAAEKLINGDWVHIYPEGRVRQVGIGYAKRGVGKLLAMTFEAQKGLPLIVPLYHEGIEHVMPQSPESNDLEKHIPCVGKKLFVLAGEPIDLSHIFQRLMPACEAAGGTRTDASPCLRLYEEVADSMAITMRLLRAELRRKVRTEEEIDLGEPFEFS